tara:strand:- start:275 stop:526 length:252 start_codon:yes stop_codon:yes gene_type:complete
METTDIIRISNNGNASAYFKWLTSNSDAKLYSIKPIEGYVESNSHLDCTVTYSPNTNSGSGKIDEDRMFLRVIIYLFIDIRWR